MSDPDPVVVFKAHSHELGGCSAKGCHITADGGTPHKVVVVNVGGTQVRFCLFHADELRRGGKCLACGEEWICDGYVAASVQYITNLEAAEAALEKYRALEVAARALQDEPHVYEAGEDSWVVRHPLNCEPNLFDCEVTKAVSLWPRMSTGFYLLYKDEHGWRTDVRTDRAPASARTALAAALSALPEKPHE